MYRCRNRVGALLTSTLGLRVAVPIAIAVGMLAPASARAASLTQVTGWSKNNVPTYISMYEYVPAKLASPPPIVVAAHYCGGSAQAFFGFTGMPAMVAGADKYGFIMIFPQTTNPASSADCWDVGSKASLTHNGGGDTQAIAEMVQYEVTKRGADANRVYAMGASSGAMLTEALMAVYPDVFKAGAEFSGVPAGCWSAGWSAASNWGGTCASGKDTQTAQAWGDMVRAMYPGYTGYRPRLQLWHGTADTTINFQNELEAIKEWTNVLGLSATPTTNMMTNMGGNNYTVEKWQNSCGQSVLEAYEEANGGHTTPIDANNVISFFGLDKTGSDPGTVGCSSSSSSSSSSTSTSASSSSSSSGTSSSSASSSSSGHVSSSSSGGVTSSSSGGASSSSSSGHVSSSSTGAATSSSGGNGASTVTSTGSGPTSTTGSSSSEATGTTSNGAGGAAASGAGGGGGSDGGGTSMHGGCSCSLPSESAANTASGMAALGLLGFVLSGRRRRRAKR